MSPGVTKKDKRKKIWSSREEALFCEIWAAKIDMLRGARKNSHIMEEMRVELETMGGVVVSVEEIKCKLHNMTSKYKKEKDKMGTSGGSPSTWTMYPAVHSILGSLKIHNLKDVVQESISEECNTLDTASSFTDLEVLLDESALIDYDDLPSTSQNYSDTSSSTPLSSSSSRNTASKNKNRDDLIQKIFKKIELLEESEEKERTQHFKWEEKIYNLEVEKKKILEKISNDSEEIKKELLNLFKKDL